MALIDELVGKARTNIARSAEPEPEGGFSDLLNSYLQSLPSDMRNSWAEPVANYFQLSTGREPTQTELEDFLKDYGRSKEAEGLFSALTKGRGGEAYDVAGIPTKESKYSSKGFQELLGESLRLGPGVGYTAGDEGALKSFQEAPPKTMGETLKGIKESPEAMNYKSKPKIGRKGLLGVLKESMRRRKMETMYMRPENLEGYEERWTKAKSRFPGSFGDTYAGSTFETEGRRAK